MKKILIISIFLFIFNSIYARDIFMNNGGYIEKAYIGVIINDYEIDGSYEVDTIYVEDSKAILQYVFTGIDTGSEDNPGTSVTTPISTMYRLLLIKNPGDTIWIFNNGETYPQTQIDFDTVNIYSNFAAIDGNNAINKYFYFNAQAKINGVIFQQLNYTFRGTLRFNFDTSYLDCNIIRDFQTEAAIISSGEYNMYVPNHLYSSNNWIKNNGIDDWCAFYISGISNNEIYSENDVFDSITSAGGRNWYILVQEANSYYYSNECILNSITATGNFYYEITGNIEIDSILYNNIVGDTTTETGDVVNIDPDFLDGTPYNNEQPQMGLSKLGSIYYLAYKTDFWDSKTEILATNKFDTDMITLVNFLPQFYTAPTPDTGLILDFNKHVSYNINQIKTYYELNYINLNKFILDVNNETGEHFKSLYELLFYFKENN